MLRRPEVDRTSAALIGRLDASGVLRPPGGSATAEPSGRPALVGGSSAGGGSLSVGRFDGPVAPGDQLG
ncbi:hypothetical protein KBX26_14360 [Micromonospora sp. C97]|nr:hypothetical protein [Micromonospora sp. C97]MBQ1031175.1 hypothetical protein [Micromonospora sp. C97]